MRKLAFFFFVSFLVTSSASWAALFENVGAEAGLEFPLAIGARAKADFSPSVYATVGVGYSPEFLLDVYGSLAGSLGILGENTSKLVVDAIGNSIYVDIRGGWKMNGDEGLFLEGGYSLLTGGGGETDVELVEDSLDEDYFVPADTPLDISAVLHNITIHAGYRWTLANWVIVGEVGLIKPVAASVDFKVDSTSVSAINREEMEDEVTDYLKDVIQSQMFIPTASVYASYYF